MKNLAIAILMFSSLSIISQEDRIDSLLNDLLFNEDDPFMIIAPPTRIDFLYTGIYFNSNSFYAGREIDNNMYNLTGQISYYNSLGFFVNASGNWYSHTAPGYSTTVLTAGYYHALNKNKTFTFRTSYSRYLYYQPDTAYDYPYKNNFSTGLSYRKKWFGSRITSNLLFGEETSMNLSAGIYSRLTLCKFGKSDRIYLRPEISAFYGPESILKETTAASDTTTSYEFVKEYSLLNTQFYIPLNISVNNFDIEFGCSVNFPFTKDENASYPVTAYFSFSVGYFLPF